MTKYCRKYVFIHHWIHGRNTQCNKLQQVSKLVTQNKEYIASWMRACERGCRCVGQSVWPFVCFSIGVLAVLSTCWPCWKVIAVSVEFSPIFNCLDHCSLTHLPVNWLRIVRFPSHTKRAVRGRNFDPFYSRPFWVDKKLWLLLPKRCLARHIEWSRSN